MHEQDVNLLRTLMNIHFTISALGGGDLRQRSDSYSSLYTTPSGAATPVSGTESPLLPFKKHAIQNHLLSAHYGSNPNSPAMLQRMFSAPNNRFIKYGSIDNSSASSICGDDDDEEPLGWSYNSTGKYCAMPQCVGNYVIWTVIDCMAMF